MRQKPEAGGRRCQVSGVGNQQKVRRCEGEKVGHGRWSAKNMNHESTKYLEQFFVVSFFRDFVMKKTSNVQHRILNILLAARS